MAYFAKIEDGKVSQVIVCESAELCVKLFGGQWVETLMEKNYAGIGHLYHEDTDTFTPPQPYPSWELSKDKTEWVPPVERPDKENVAWDEQAKAWTISEKL